MFSVRDAVEAFIRLVRAEIAPNAVLVPPDDAFEVTRLPSLVLQGPMLLEDKPRRTMGKQVVKDTDALMYEERPYPRLYHLDFDIIATTAKEAELVDLAAKVVAFFAFHRELEVPPDGAKLALTEVTPMGGLGRVNLTNLKQSSGRYRIEDCPVYGEEVQTGKLILTTIFEYQGPAIDEARTHEPTG
ncbi:MAG TPA: hypothetical protein P5532_25405 [Planctomycetota bacterium]|nr:hypothetical protein [Planctomycetota bacterium]